MTREEMRAALMHEVQHDVYPVRVRPLDTGVMHGPLRRCEAPGCLDQATYVAGRYCPHHLFNRPGQPLRSFRPEDMNGCDGLSPRR